MREEKTEQLHFRVTLSEKERIKKSAMRAGLSMSDYLRRQALQKQVKVITPEFISEYKQVCGEFGRFGNNLNQVARYLNGGGNQDTAAWWIGRYQREFSDALIRLKMAVDKMVAA